jgi:type IV pilus assembly protein PilB
VPGEIAAAAKLFKGKGCPVCSGTGYKGRIALYEVMPMAEELKELVLMGASTSEIRREAMRLGMKTLRQSGVAKLLEGTTTYQEVLRTTVKDN